MVEPRGKQTVVTINEISYCLDELIGRGASSFVYKAHVERLHISGEKAKTFFVIKEFSPIDLDRYLVREKDGTIKLIEGYDIFGDLLDLRRKRFDAEVDNYPSYERNNPSFVFLPLWGNCENGLLVCSTSEGQSLEKWKELFQKKADIEKQELYIYIKACLNIVKKVIEALKELHQKRIHLDLKTENIYLSGSSLSPKQIVEGANFQVKFLDFGSACSKGAFDNKETLEEALQNLSITEAFAAPILIDMIPSRCDPMTRRERAIYINPNVDYYSALKVAQDLLVPLWRTDPYCTDVVGLGNSDKDKNIRKSVCSIFECCDNFDAFPSRRRSPKVCEDVASEDKKPYEEFRDDYNKNPDRVRNDILNRIKNVIRVIDNPAGFYVEYALERAKTVLREVCGDSIYDELHTGNIDEKLLAPVKYNDKSLKLFEYYEDRKKDASNVQAILMSAAGGAGKTSALLHLFKRLLKNALSDDTAIIPFFIPLGRVEHNNINKFLCREYFGSDSGSNSLENWISGTERRILFILDGFEDYRGNDEYLKGWWKSIKENSPKFSRDLIISVRTMESPINENNSINCSFPLSTICEDKKDGFDILEMQGLTKEQLNDYFVGDDGYPLLDTSAKHSELLYLPMLAKLAKEVLVSPSNTYSVYWNQRSDLKLDEISQARLMKAYIDIQIYKKASQEDVSKWKESIFSSISKIAASKAHWKFDTHANDIDFDIACECDIMKEDKDKGHIFTHRLWHEFMIAYWLRNQIDEYLVDGNRKIDSGVYELSFSESVYRLAGELLGEEKTKAALNKLRNLKAAIDFSNLLKEENITAGAVLRYLTRLNRPTMTMREINELSEDARATDHVANLTSNVINIMKQQYKRDFASVDLSYLDLTATSLQKITGVTIKNCQESSYHIETFGIPICAHIEKDNICAWGKYVIAVVRFKGTLAEQKERRAFVVIDKARKEITTCHIGDLFYFDEICIREEYDMFARIAGYRRLGENSYQVTILNLNERGEIFIVPSSQSGVIKAVPEVKENNDECLTAAYEAICKKASDRSKCDFCQMQRRRIKDVPECPCERRSAN